MPRRKKDTLVDSPLEEFMEDPRTGARMRRPSDVSDAFNPCHVREFVEAFEDALVCCPLRDALLANITPTEEADSLLHMFDSLTPWEKANAIFKLKTVVAEWVASEGLLWATTARRTDD